MPGFPPTLSGYVLTDLDLLQRGQRPEDWPLTATRARDGVSGLFIAGDARHGSVKRVGAAVGEGAMATALAELRLRELEVEGLMATIEVEQADITKLDVDAIANAEHAVAPRGRRRRRHLPGRGSEVQRESDKRAPIGSARRSPRPPARCRRWVIHAATMELGGPTSAGVIRRAIASTLAAAEELGARSLALVAFGTGVGGFPLEQAPDRGRGGPPPMATAPWNGSSSRSTAPRQRRRSGRRGGARRGRRPRRRSAPARPPAGQRKGGRPALPGPVGR